MDFDPHTIIIVRPRPHAAQHRAEIFLSDLQFACPITLKVGRYASGIVARRLLTNGRFLNYEDIEEIDRSHIRVIAARADNRPIAKLLDAICARPVPRRIPELPAFDDDTEAEPLVQPPRNTPVTARLCPTDLDTRFSDVWHAFTDPHWAYAENGKCFLALCYPRLQTSVVICEHENTWETTEGVKNFYGAVARLAGRRPPFRISKGFADRRPTESSTERQQD